MAHSFVWAPLLRNPGGVGSCVQQCALSSPLLSISLYFILPLFLSLVPALRHSGTASCLTASPRKPFKFGARSTAPNSLSLLPSPPAQPGAISLRPRVLSPFPSPTRCLLLSSSRQRETESLLPAYLFYAPPAAQSLAPFLSFIHGRIVNLPSSALCSILTLHHLSVCKLPLVLSF